MPAPAPAPASHLALPPAPLPLQVEPALLLAALDQALAELYRKSGLPPPPGFSPRPPNPKHLAQLMRLLPGKGEALGWLGRSAVGRGSKEEEER